ncbi:hypothetical protein NBRC116592_25690 [Colwellia sp. KU-HH00111]|uniref:HPF/RaiA family ribosome-associated protein n=1 Tax=Colwellia sp. KU-HH00111 TaxID=3127652 RepID=UPI00310A33BC
MKVTIASVGVKLNKALKTNVERKVQLTLSKLEPYISTISIKLSSSIDTRGISNNHCQLTIAVINQPNLVIEDTQADIECVLDRVLQKASRMIERLVVHNK